MRWDGFNVVLANQWTFADVLPFTPKGDPRTIGLAILIPWETAKNQCDSHDAENIFKIRLKTRSHAIPASSFMLEHTIEGVPPVVHHQAHSPCCCKCRRTVCSDTCCFPNDPISWFTTRDLAVRSIKVIRVRCSSSCVLMRITAEMQHIVSYEPLLPIDSLFCR